MQQQRPCLSSRLPLAEVELNNLSFRYPGAAEATLQDLDLRIESGEAHALLGSSGAGKSTLLNLLSGLLSATAGELRLAGSELADLAPAARGVAQVFQFPVLYESMPVLSNLAFPLQALRIRRRERDSRAREIARHLEIESILHKRPAQLSLYEKQLVSIGKALVRPDVSLVLLDEPLTAAEPARKWRLRQTLKALQRESGATMIYVTHDQTEALTFADRISVMHGGRILQTGTPAQLLDKPAHEFVGYFVGAPGMNFLDGHAGIAEFLTSFGPTAEAFRIGFRPEWARLKQRAGTEPAVLELAADIKAVRILGTHRGMPFGLVEAQASGSTVVTRQALAGIEPGPAQLSIDRYQGFRQGWAADA